MDKPISVGDFVVVVRDHICCPATDPHVGKHFTVTGFKTVRGACRRCGDTTTLINALGEGSEKGYDVRRLKRIPPLADLDGKKDAADKPITLDGEIERLRKMVSA